jgi:hypothetical protein
MVRRRRLDVDELAYDEACYAALDPLPERRRRLRARGRRK